MENDQMNCGHLYFYPSANNRANMLFLGNNNLIFPGQRTTMMNMDDNKISKRPFFTSAEETLYDEEYYYDEQLPEKKRRLSPEQVVLLEKSFEEENKLEPERKIELAKKLGLQPRQVAVWFQNRRARLKTKQIERDYEILKASYDELVSDYDALVKENAMLKAKVEYFKEKCRALEEIEKNLAGQNAEIAQLLQEDGPMKIAQEKLIKVEDGQSSGSDSAICNEEKFKMVMDSSGDSYFGCPPPYIAAAAAAAAVQSEEDDISDDGRSYFSNILTVAPAVVHHRGQEEEEEEDGPALGWWVWS